MQIAFFITSERIHQLLRGNALAICRLAFACISLFVFICSFQCLADNKSVSIGVADFPPYSIVQGATVSGVEVDIVRESLSIMGYQIEFEVFPYGRLPSAFRNKNIDGTIVTLKHFDTIDVFYSELVLVQYQTVAVHLKNRNFQIFDISDLADKSILAHQRANQFYGDEFKQLSSTAQYTETAQQKAQVKMLFKERIDVIVLAHEIFNYYKTRADYQEKSREYSISKIFGEKFGFYNAFWHQDVRDDFNEGLAKIKENGRYNEILSQYLKEYQPES